MLPIYDDNPRRSWPLAATGFLGLHVLISLLSLVGLELGPLAMLGYGNFAGAPPDAPLGVAVFGPVSAVLIALYLIWQSCHLWVLADNVEDQLGFGGFLAAYVVIGWFGYLAAGGDDSVRPGGFPQATTAAMLAIYTVHFPRQQILFVRFRGMRATRAAAADVNPHGLGYTWLVFLGGQLLATWALPIPIGPVFIGIAAGGMLGAITASRPHREKTFVVHPLAESPFTPEEERMTPPIDRRIPSAARAAAPRPSASSPKNQSTTTARLEGRVTGTHGRTVPGSATLWAAIRLDDDLGNLDRLARLIRAHTHEPVFDITRRLRHVRGLLGVELLEANARTLAEAARTLGVAALAVPWPLPPLQPRQRVQSVAWTDRSIALQTTGAEGRTFDIPWRRIRVAAATRVRASAGGGVGSGGGAGSGGRAGSGGSASRGVSLAEWDTLMAPLGDRATVLPSLPTRTTTRIDLLVEPHESADHGSNAPPIHLSVEEGRCGFAIDAVSGGFEALAEALLAHRSILATNPGLGLVAQRGRPIARWGYLEFVSEAFRLSYLAWLSALAHPARRGVDPGSTDSEISFLE